MLTRFIDGFSSSLPLGGPPSGRCVAVGVAVAGIVAWRQRERHTPGQATHEVGNATSIDREPATVGEGMR